MKTIKEKIKQTNKKMNNWVNEAIKHQQNNFWSALYFYTDIHKRDRYKHDHREVFCVNLMIH